MFQDNKNIKLYFRDVTQANVLLNANFKPKFYLQSQRKIIPLLNASFDNIFTILKFLYDIPEVGNYCFATYYIYHRINLK